MSEQKIPYYLSFGDVIRVLRAIDESPYQELQLELGDLKLRFVQDGKEERLPAQPIAPKASVPETPRAALPAAPVTSAELDGTPVLAPLAGTFYRAPAPGAPPYVEVGAAVKEGDTVGILEIMKLMNLVTAPCSGVISRICVQNEELVKHGQVLAFIDPERAG